MSRRCGACSHRSAPAPRRPVAWPKRVASRCGLVVCLAVVFLQGLAAQPATSAEPFRDLRQQATPYAGPGRELPEPRDVPEVRIGYFGPSDPAHPEFGDAWRAAQLAIEQANRAGGYQGKPFRLLARWSENPWKTGAGHVTKLVYVDDVWALIGGIDGATTHLAEQVVAKARLTLVSAGSTDRTANLANVSWMFSCLPGDHLQAPVLADRLAQTVGEKAFVMLSADDHDSRQFVTEFGKALHKRQLAPQFQFTCQPSADRVAELLARTVEAAPAAVVLVAPPRESASLLASLRAAGYRGPVCGGPALGRRVFRELAGGHADGVLFPLLVDPTADARAFREAFIGRHQVEPDFSAVGTYDAVLLLVAAIRQAGLNRARIGDAVKSLSPWSGASGRIEWDHSGSNCREVQIATLRNGRVTPDRSGSHAR